MNDDMHDNDMGSSAPRSNGGEQKNKLFVGGLPWAVTNDMLKDMFASYGDIEEAVVITDKYSGRSKGFGFVTFVKDEDAEKALEMDGKDVEGRNITVNIAQPKKPRN